MPEQVSISMGTRRLVASSIGFASLARLHEKISEHTDKDIYIDCSDLVWMDAHLSAPLATIVDRSKLLGNQLQLTNLHPSIRLILQKNRLLKTKAKDTYGTTIQLTRFSLEEAVDFAHYTRHGLLQNKMPKMEKSLLSKFFETIDELFSNCSLHSKSPTKIIACGQFFPQSKELSFSISDGGRGIDGSLANAGITFDKTSEAIDWAMQSNNTSRHGDIPGGLGLKLFKDFIAKNNGSIKVVSNDGYWCQDGGDTEMNDISCGLPGTTVTLTINTADKKRYDMPLNPHSVSDLW